MVFIISNPEDYDIPCRGTYEECMNALTAEADKYPDLVKTIDSTIHEDDNGMIVGHYDLSFYTADDVYLFSLIICTGAVGDEEDPPPADVLLKAELICSALSNRN